ncbi:MAG TPA: VWA domain-containing protein [Thermoanaerobaculia bacterium]|nr:VWA domain-containing protein [Thermoanaerobaculia bacterium]
MKKSALAVACLALALPLPLPGQVPEPEITDTISVNYVMVPFTAFGRNGIPITNLRPRDVKLLVDGVPVATDLFERSMNAPVSFSIVIDGSGSMALAGKMEGAAAAVQTVVGKAKPGDDFALFMFDNREVHELVPFTSDGAAIVEGLSKVRPYGRTAFFDAIATMPEKTQMGKNPTRAIILVSDGIDNASRLTRLQLAAKLEGVAVPIYALAPRDPRLPRIRGAVTEEMADLGVLEEVAVSTGGKLFLGNRPEHFVSAAATLDRALRAQYLIGFPPTGAGAVKYRRISLETAGRVRSVRVRAGYQGTEPPVRGATR